MAASASDAFHLVIPSMPGYGFSGKPTGTGWDPDRIARAWAELMKRLGYTRYVAQGGDWGSPVSERDGAPGAARIARHPHQLAGDGTARRGDGARRSAGPRRRDSPRRNARRSTRSTRSTRRAWAYAAMMGTRPQTIGYGLDGLSGRPCGLDARLQTSRELPMTPLTSADERRRARQRHAVLADEHARPRRRGSTGRPAAKAFFSRPRR